jgi:hypothetical protein
MSITCDFIATRGPKAGKPCGKPATVWGGSRCEKHPVHPHGAPAPEEPAPAPAPEEPAPAPAHEDPMPEPDAPAPAPEPDSPERLREQLTMCRTVLENTRTERDIALNAIDTAWKPLVATLREEKSEAMATIDQLRLELAELRNFKRDTEAKEADRKKKLAEYSKNSLARKEERIAELPEAEREAIRTATLEKARERAKKYHEKQKTLIAEAKRVLAQQPAGGAGHA